MLDGDDSFIGEAASAGYDPYLEYVLLGTNVTDGIFGWMRMGINTSASYPVNPTIHRTFGRAKANITFFQLTAASILGADGGTALRNLTEYVSGKVH